MGTTAHGLVYPEDYNERADVPTVLTDVVLAIEDALVAQDEQATTVLAALAAAAPIGMIVAYGGSTLPSGWKWCDGSAHGSSALAAVLGSSLAPDLRDRFIVGAGGAYAANATGGAASVTLSAAQSGLPSHNHSVSVYEGTEAAGDGDWVDTAPAPGGGGALVPVGKTSYESTNAASPHENRPPYWALRYIIKAA